MIKEEREFNDILRLNYLFISNLNSKFYLFNMIDLNLKKQPKSKEISLFQKVNKFI